MKIEQFEFDKGSEEKISCLRHGKNWPIVYLLCNDEELYVGESANFSRRLKEHLADERRTALTQISLIDDDHFNKSAILDIESDLIRLFDADQKYKLQNLQVGQNQAHDYYHRAQYKDMMQTIWNELYSLDMAENDYISIENSELFKFSPYKTLTHDQYDTVNAILRDLGTNLLSNTPSTMAVRGQAGTGKSILAIYLMKVLSDIKHKEITQFDLDDLEKAEKYEDGMLDSLLHVVNTSNLKIGLVVPVRSFRETLKNVFGNVENLKKNMLITASDVANAYLKGKPYDIVLVDEAQRLHRAKNIQYLRDFYEKNIELGFDKHGGTELDWLQKCTKHQIFFYDASQQVSGADIAIEDLNAIPYTNEFHIQTQMRVRGGDAYMTYIKEMLSDNPPDERLSLNDYEVKLFGDVNDMVEEIKSKDDVYGLCRTIAGYAWPWNTNEKKKVTQYDYDIEIDGYRYVWNKNNIAWIPQENSINEIGSIHTTQGHDLNYVGLIIGNDITYDFDQKEIIVRKDQVFDANAKKGLSDEEIRNNILNAYYILLSRAQRGVYIYVCDGEFRKYLRQFF